MVRNDENKISVQVTSSNGSIIIVGDTEGQNVSRKNRRLLNKASGTHRNRQEPIQLEEQDRRRMTLKAKHNVESQSPKNGGRKCKDGQGNCKSFSSVAASSGRAEPAKQSTKKLSQGDVKRINHLTVP